MEHELEGLRRELTEKTIEVMKLRKQVSLQVFHGQNISNTISTTRHV
jgi:hypothetical protein